jgi:hypothetical protein
VFFVDRFFGLHGSQRKSSSVTGTTVSSQLSAASLAGAGSSLSRLPAAGDHGGEPAVLTLRGERQRFCDGISRREFLKIGGLAMGGFGLTD